MSDSADFFSPERLKMISIEVAEQARKRVLASFAPFGVIAVAFGISSYKDLRKKSEELDKRTIETVARNDSLRKLTDALRIVVQFQSEALSANNQKADASLTRLQQYYDQLADRAAGQQQQLQSAVTTANSTSARVNQSFDALASSTKIRVDELLGTATLANQNAERAVRIAEEGSVQTVGARQRRDLYGTRFKVFFSGVSGDALRSVEFFDENDKVIWRRDRLTSLEAIGLPEENPEIYVSVVNMLDIPGGPLRLIGSSRADAATFRITRVHPAERQRGPVFTATQLPAPLTQVRNEH